MKNKNSLRILALLMAVLVAFSSFSLAASAAYKDVDTVKNVILLIGDGMGENHLKWTKDEYDTDLFMETLPYRGQSITDSLSGTTDSAAGATALSCGVHSYNSNVGTLSPTINGCGFKVFTYQNTCEVALSLGKRAGVLTSDLNSGATPACFSAHTEVRGNTEDITNQQLKSNLNLIWAVNNGLLTEKNITENGWKYVNDADDISNLKDGDRSFGAFDNAINFSDNEEDTTLSELTTMAINQLDNEKGFFLMVEGAHIDKGSHANDKEIMMKSLLEFDKAIKNAVEFAEKDGNTIVIVTADHETGAIKYNSETKEWGFTSGDHSNANVPLFIYGSDKLTKDGAAIENINVAIFTQKMLGNTEEYPAKTFNYNIVADFFKALFKAIAKAF